jgi:hypothetical protein
VRKRGKRFQRRRREVQRWRQSRINERSDDERFVDDRYFGTATPPLVWLAETAVQTLKPLVRDNQEISATELLQDLMKNGRSQLDQMRATRTAFLADARADHASFVARSTKHWRSAFDLLEAFIWNSVELAVWVEQRVEGWGVKDQMTKIMLRQIGRATLIAREIAWLLRGGYPEGARARWRTLHEVAVTMTYVRQHGPWAAERMLARAVLCWRTRARE